MINENLISEYSGTNFSVTKVDGVSRMQYASSDEHWIENREEYGSIFMGDGPSPDPDNPFVLGSVLHKRIFEDIPNNYKGFYTGLPEFKIAFDVRDGDTLIFNAHEIHANTDFKVLSEKLKRDDLTDNNFAGRMSVVCYMRNKLNRCGK